MYLELALCGVTVLVLAATVWLGCDFQHQWLTHDDGCYHLLPARKSLRPVMPTIFLDWEKLRRMSFDTRQPRRTYLLTKKDRKLLERAEEPVMWDARLEESIANRRYQAEERRNAKAQAAKMARSVMASPEPGKSKISLVMDKNKSARAVLEQVKSARSAMDQIKTARGLTPAKKSQALTPRATTTKARTKASKTLKKISTVKETAAVPNQAKGMWRILADGNGKRGEISNSGTLESATRTNDDLTRRRNLGTRTARTEDVEERWRLKTMEGRFQKN